VRLRDVLDTGRGLPRAGCDTPVLLMGYANPVMHMGYATFADRARACGVDALLTVDIPPEEVSELNPSSSASAWTIFSYRADHACRSACTLLRIRPAALSITYRSRASPAPVNLDQAAVAAQVEEIRQHTALPICVGFGIKDGPSAASVASGGGWRGDRLGAGAALADLAAEGAQGKAILDAARAMLMDIRTHVDALRPDAA
jgi:tryptophan synthase alpha chain